MQQQNVPQVACDYFAKNGLGFPPVFAEEHLGNPECKQGQKEKDVFQKAPEKTVSF